MSSIKALCPDAKPVRAVAFNKTGGSNWGVPWHQDRIIALAGRHKVEGFKNWTSKAGVWHCEPPESYLSEMLFVRVHLDPTNAANGAMKIALGSHRAGLVSGPQAEAIADEYPIETCDADRGDILVLKMLTLHSSKPSQSAENRRALRIDLSPDALPVPLEWLTLASSG